MTQASNADEPGLELGEHSSKSERMQDRQTDRLSLRGAVAQSVCGATVGAGIRLVGGLVLGVYGHSSSSSTAGFGLGLERVGAGASATAAVARRCLSLRCRVGGMGETSTADSMCASQAKHGL